MQFADARRSTAVHKMFPRCDVEQQSPNSNALQAADYCRKKICDQTGFPTQSSDPSHAFLFFEHGTMSSCGNRTDIAEVAQSCMDGDSFLNIAKKAPVIVIKYGRSIRELCDILRSEKKQTRGKDPDGKVIHHTCIWLYGPTATGKSEFAYDYVDAGGKYWKDYITIW